MEPVADARRARSPAAGRSVRTWLCNPSGLGGGGEDGSRTPGRRCNGPGVWGGGQRQARAGAGLDLGVWLWKASGAEGAVCWGDEGEEVSPG